jgi:hypothetical protein
VLRTGAELQALAKMNGVMEDNRNGMQDHQRKKKNVFLPNLNLLLPTNNNTSKFDTLCLCIMPFHVTKYT